MEFRLLMNGSKWVLLVILGGVVVGCTPPKFAGFDIKPHDGEGPGFQFSDADATASSPVVIISVPDRPLTSADDRNRMSIEKAWLSVYVPKQSAFQAVGSALCEYSRHGEHPFANSMSLRMVAEVVAVATIFTWATGQSPMAASDKAPARAVKYLRAATSMIIGHAVLAWAAPWGLYELACST